jgi:hypothetical protein
MDKKAFEEKVLEILKKNYYPLGEMDDDETCASDIATLIEPLLELAEQKPKSAEEMIKDYIINGTGVYEGIQLIRKERCIEAMHEFASQKPDIIDKEWIYHIIDQTTAFSKLLIDNHFKRHEQQPK